MERACRERLHNTSGGSKETELKELAVNPIRAPVGVRAVIIVTPVANAPNASRNSSEEKLGGDALRNYLAADAAATGSGAAGSTNLAPPALAT